MSNDMNDKFCRICRGEETPEEPLSNPCKCSGSMKYVHQDCLLEWLEHARVRTRCDVCGTSYSLKRRYRSDMSNLLSPKDYISFTIQILREKYYIIWYTVRGIAMVSTVALVTKYVLEFAIIFAETSPVMLSDFNKSWATLRSRMHQSPPRPSFVPILDTIFAPIIPQSEFRSSWINGMVLIIGFLCSAILTWFMVVYVLNEEIMEHERDHIENGEVAHMDHGDDETLIAYYQSNGAMPMLIDGDGDGDTPHTTLAEPETVVRFAPRNLFEDPRPENVAQREEDELAGLAGLQDEDDGENLGLFLRRLIADLFGGPNVAIFPSFFSILLFFGTLAAVYPSIYWPSLKFKQSVGLGASKLLKTVKAPPSVVNAVENAFYGAPKTVPGHLTLLFVVQGLSIATFRLCILHYMRPLLTREWGKALVIFAHRMFAIVKSLLITLIETLVFPEFCGILLHVATLPITPSLYWHWDAYMRHPHRTLFIQWLIGYLYMHGLQIFVTACRKFFRKGVLFFLYDNDSTALMRSIMILSLPKQLKRILHSAGIYAAFILLGVGLTSLLLRLVEAQSFPLELSYWPGINLLRLWPFVVLMHSLTVPLTGSGKQLKNVLTLWVRDRVWLRMFAFITKQLDLESWFFGTPRVLNKEEEEKLNNKDESLGYFVRAPVEMPRLKQKSLVLFVPVTAENARLDGKKGVQPNELSKYTVVWRPPHFRSRIGLLALFSWGFISLLTLMFTLIPLKAGRFLDSVFMDNVIKNDIILSAVGMTFCFPLYAQLLRFFPPPELSGCARFTAISGNLPSIFGHSLYNSANWAVAFVLLNNIAPTSPNHWLFFSSSSDQLWVQIFTTTLNIIMCTLMNLCSASWNKGKIITADCIVLEFGLELIGVLPPPGIKIRFVSGALALYHLWLVWKSSKPAEQLDEIVRETLYLEAIDVQNYQPEQAN